MEKFGHFFEFIAALNSAYIVSNHFIKSLIININRDFTKLQERLTGILARQKKHEDYLIQEGGKCPAGLIKIVQDLNTKNKILLDTLSGHDEELKATIEKKGISENFNFLCLFGSLYCLLILILNGFEYDFHTPFSRESFLLFNVFCILVLFWLFLNKSKKYNPSYKKIIVIFFTGLLIIPGYLILQWIWPSFECTYDFKYVNIAISILVPTSHFFYYFITTTKTTKSLSAKLWADISKADKAVTDFAAEMNTSLELISKIQVRDHGSSDKESS